MVSSGLYSVEAVQLCPAFFRLPTHLPTGPHPLRSPGIPACWPSRVDGPPAPGLRILIAGDFLLPDIPSRWASPVSFGSGAMECSGCLQALRTMWMVLPKQAASLQGSLSVN